jgi:hypothetical protein
MFDTKQFPEEFGKNYNNIYIFEENQPDFTGIELQAYWNQISVSVPASWLSLLTGFRV